MVSSFGWFYLYRFPDDYRDGIIFFSENGATRIPTAKVWSLKTAWK